jgi:hypothetical protein
MWLTLSQLAGPVALYWHFSSLPMSALILSTADPRTFFERLFFGPGPEPLSPLIAIL